MSGQERLEAMLDALPHKKGCDGFYGDPPCTCYPEVVKASDAYVDSAPPASAPETSEHHCEDTACLTCCPATAGELTHGKHVAEESVSNLLVTVNEYQNAANENAALRARADAAGAELARVDEAIARRDALADAPNRYTAIYRACTRAGQADAAEERVRVLEKALRDALEVARWMSGSPDFSPEGVAARGWFVMRPKLDAAAAALALA